MYIFIDIRKERRGEGGRGGVEGCVCVSPSARAAPGLVVVVVVFHKKEAISYKVRSCRQGLKKKEVSNGRKNNNNKIRIRNRRRKEKKRKEKRNVHQR